MSFGGKFYLLMNYGNHFSMPTIMLTKNIFFLYDMIHYNIDSSMHEKTKTKVVHKNVSQDYHKVRQFHNQEIFLRNLKKLPCVTFCGP